MRIAWSRALGVVAVGIASIVVAGCPEDNDPPEDAAIVVGDDSGRDAAIVERDAPERADTGPMCGQVGYVGGACATARCFEPWVCQEEVVRTIPSVLRDGTAGRPFSISYYPGGLCEGSCNPNLRDQCNSCSSCLSSGEDEAGNELGSCYMNCAVNATDRGGCNEGYGCNRAYGACTPACTVIEGVDSCQFSIETDDDGNSTIYDEGVDYPSHCNVGTGLCETTGRAGARAGDDCEDEFDCETNGVCYRSEDPDAPATLQDGYCIRIGCNDTDLRCQDGDVCTQSLFGLPGGVCMRGCSVGSEETADQRFGAAGGNPECGAGEACFWDGVHGATGLNGGCFPGNYNDVPAYNVGEGCDTDADCWSPYGLGRCLFSEGNALGDRVGRGICVVGGCGTSSGGAGLRVADAVVAVPDPSEICQTTGAPAGSSNDRCVAFSETQTFCVAGCATAAECPTGYACPNLGSGLVALRICWPECMVDADCREGASCLNERRGACNPDTDSCTCTDGGPRVDAGVVAADAGVDAAVDPDEGDAEVAADGSAPEGDDASVTP